MDGVGYGRVVPCDWLSQIGDHLNGLLKLLLGVRMSRFIVGTEVSYQVVVLVYLDSCRLICVSFLWSGKFDWKKQRITEHRCGIGNAVSAAALK